VGTQRRKRRPSGRKPQSLADALFSKTQQRVLGVLLGQPDRSFFTKEIIRAASGGAGAAQRELARLEKSDIVSASRVGNQKHYQANRANPLFDELRGIVLKTFGIAEPLREALEPLGDRIALALIYGSVAKGDDRGRSDIDLLVVARDVTLEQLFTQLARAEKRLGRRINPTLYTPDEFRRRRRAKNPFLEKVMLGKTLPLIGSVDDLAISG
jgi:predicted nucleotidyltransferase